MKISVVIPVYNGEKYLKECINSVLNQPYKDIEIITINDGSKDNSVDILNKVAQTDKRLNVIDQKNHGVAYTRNKGIDIATGNYIVFLDQDDMWVTDFLTEDVINEIKQEKCDMVSFAYYQANQDISRLKLIERQRKIIDHPKENAGENYRHHSSYMYNIELLKKYHIDTDEYRNEDERFRMKCIYFANKILFLDKAIFIYRNNSFSVTHGNEDVKKVFFSSLEGYEKLRNQSVQYQWLMEYCDNTQLRLLLGLFQNSSNKECAIYEKTYHYKELWEKHGWLSGRDKKEWKLYRNNRKFFVIKSKGKRFIIIILRYLSQNRFLKKFYESKKYPLKRDEVNEIGKNKGIISNS